MSLWKVAWRSIRQRSLVSTLTVLSMGLGVALVVAVLVVYGVVDQSFHRGGEGYDLIVGAKGGKEQLVLNTVFYLSQPIGNIPYSFYEELTEANSAAGGNGHSGLHGPYLSEFPRGRHRARYVHRAEISRRQKYEFADGRNFKADNHFEAVLGAIAACEDRLAGRRNVSRLSTDRAPAATSMRRIPRRWRSGTHRHAGRSRHVRQHARLSGNPPRMKMLQRERGTRPS